MQQEFAPAEAAPIDVTQVLIVGAGPVGLSLATELGHRGISAIIVEQHDRVGQQPRAKTTNVRTMEHMRRWGIAEAVRKAAPLPPDYPTDVIFATRLFGYELARFENALYGRRERNELFSEPAQWIPQYKVEGVLRDHVLTLPTIDLRMSTALIGFEESGQHVLATVEDLAAGRKRQIRARYMVGADGARSFVRRALDIELEGRHSFAQNCGIVFRAPRLGQMHPQKPAIMYWLVNDDAPGFSGPMDSGDLWFFIMPTPDGFGTVDEARARRAIIDAAGRDLAVEILTLDPWSAHSLIAERYGTARIFLAGDACHLHPPFGGYGMNLGIGDAVDLGWKLAAVLKGWGGRDLLHSYAAERRPVHRRVIDEAVANSGLLSHNLVRPGLEAPGPEGDALRRTLGVEILREKRREFLNLGVILGIPYEGSPLIAADGTRPPEWHYSDYRPSASPGSLAPHLWLGDGTSLYDRLGAGFTLLVTASGAEDGIAALAAAAAACALPLTVVTPGDDRLRDLYGAALVLIRPDQHVAWRGDRLDRPARAIIDRVRGALRMSG